MDHYGLISAGGDPRDLEAVAESMWRMGIGGGGGGGSGSSGGGVAPYPERPGEPDCAYYMRTGGCSYGERCRYNHPLDRQSLVIGAARLGSGEYPERFGQPFCEYYLKTGTCKFGSSCKYHHPRQGGGSVSPVSLNYYGYPLRPGEKECSYFMKTGQCKFGSTCKFHHPQPTSSSVPSPAPVFYQTVQSPSIATPQQYPHVGGWQVGRSSSALPGTYMPSSYGPVVLSPGVLPVPGWGPYPAPLSLALSPGSQQSAQAGPFYGPSTQLSPSTTACPDPYHPETSTVGPSSSTQKGHILPQRPGQPECQFYMRTGDCKFGAICKYHHPLDWSTTVTNSILSPLGLPLRPEFSKWFRILGCINWYQSYSCYIKLVSELFLLHQLVLELFLLHQLVSELFLLHQISIRAILAASNWGLSFALTMPTMGCASSGQLANLIIQLTHWIVVMLYVL